MILMFLGRVGSLTIFTAILSINIVKKDNISFFPIFKFLNEFILFPPDSNESNLSYNLHFIYTDKY